MTRTLDPLIAAAIAAQNAEVIHFVQLDSSGGTVRLVTGTFDMEWDAQTWSAIGGLLEIGASEETPDRKGQGLSLVLSGVDQTIIAAILQNDVRGREIRVWRAWLEDGAILADPMEIFRGYQNEQYRIVEERPIELERGTVRVETRVVSRTAALHQIRRVLSNVTSHNDMLARLGQATGDEFFKQVPQLAGRKIYWGTENPDEATKVVNGSGYTTGGSDDEGGRRAKRR